MEIPRKARDLILMIMSVIMAMIVTMMMLMMMLMAWLKLAAYRITKLLDGCLEHFLRSFR